MSTSAPPPGSTTPPPPLAPPDEQFWEKYSPHHEFPLSSVGSIALHVGGLVLILLALWLLSRLSISDKTAVPMRAVIVAGDGEGAEGRGGGGGDQRKEDVDPIRQTLPKREVPNADMERVVEDIKPYLPKVPSTRDGLRPEDLPTPKRIAGLDEATKKALMEGMSGKKGKGAGEGSGGPGPEGAGSGNAGDPSSSANRAVRWELNFKTANGKDYLDQLAAMKATLVFPQPPNWKTNKVYRNIGAGPAAGEDFDINKLPGLYFVDDDAGSASRLARSMGLDYSPPHFIAFFPKDIEEELATKEREFRGRKEGEIFSTSFKILVRDGRPTIVVIDQTPVRK